MGKNCCFVEDFMVLNKEPADTEVVIRLFPTGDIIESFDNDTHPYVFNFGQSSTNLPKASDSNYYHCMNGCILTNLKPLLITILQSRPAPIIHPDEPTNRILGVYTFSLLISCAEQVLDVNDVVLYSVVNTSVKDNDKNNIEDNMQQE